MKKVKEYYTLASPYVYANGEAINVKALEQLDKEVNSMIKDGWQPFGGISTTDKCATQVLVKYED